MGWDRGQGENSFCQHFRHSRHGGSAQVTVACPEEAGVTALDAYTSHCDFEEVRRAQVLSAERLCSQR